MSELRFESAGVLGTGMVGALFLTTRFETENEHHFLDFRAAGQPVLFVVWHGHLLPLVHRHRKQGIVALVSEHDDGEYVKRVMVRNGFGTVRGSSSRGGSRGLKGLVRAANSGRDVAITPDGPRGPKGVLKPSSLAVAQMVGLPIIPIAVSASGWRFRSWDGFLVPRPFSTISIDYLAPRAVARDAGREGLERVASEIEGALHAREAELAARSA